MERRLSYVLRRSLILVVGIMVILTAEFVVLRVMPEDPSLLARNAYPAIREDPAYLELVNSTFSKSLFSQYVDFIGDMLTGDFHLSPWYTYDSGGLISGYLGRTLIVFVTSLTISLLLASLLGWWITGRASGVRKAASCIPVAIFAVPVVAWAWFLGQALSISTQILPVGGTFPFGEEPTGFFEDLPEYLRYAALPIMVVTMSTFGVMTLALIHGMNAVKASRPDGSPGGPRLMDGFFISLPNLQFIVAATMCFVVFTERFFEFAGLGWRLFESIYRWEYFVLQAIVFVLAAVVFLTNYILGLMVTLLRPERKLDQYLDEGHPPLSEGEVHEMGQDVAGRSSILASSVSVIRDYLRSRVGIVSLVVLAGLSVLAIVGPMLSSGPTGFMREYSSTDLFLDGAGPLLMIPLIVGLSSVVIGLLVGVMSGALRPYFADSAVTGAMQGVLAIPIPCMLIIWSIAESDWMNTELSVAKVMVLPAAAVITLLVCHGFVSSLRGSQTEGLPLTIRSRIRRMARPLSYWVLSGLKFVVPMTAILVFMMDFAGFTRLESWGAEVAYSANRASYVRMDQWDYILPPFFGMALLVVSMFLALDALEKVLRSGHRSNARRQTES